MFEQNLMYIRIKQKNIYASDNMPGLYNKIVDEIAIH